MRISWVTSPICLAIAQKFLAPEAWVPFFNMVAFVFGTCMLTSLLTMDTCTNLLQTSIPRPKDNYDSRRRQMLAKISNRSTFVNGFYFIFYAFIHTFLDNLLLVADRLGRQAFEW